MMSEATFATYCVDVDFGWQDQYRNANWRQTSINVWLGDDLEEAFRIAKRYAVLPEVVGVMVLRWEGEWHTVEAWNAPIAPDADPDHEVAEQIAAWLETKASPSAMNYLAECVRQGKWKP